MKGLQWTLLSLVAGCLGHSVGANLDHQALAVNLKGGKDLTPQAINALRLPIDAGTLPLE